MFGILHASVLNFVQTKIAHLRELTGDQRKLLVTFLLYGFAAPLVVTYSGTYVWRNSESILLLGLFLCLYPLGLSLGFLLNGLLLRLYRPSILYAIGCLTVGFAPYVLVSVSFTWTHVLLSGLALGTAAGLYYGNRNLLTGIVNADKHKYAFMSLESLVGTMTQIISPALIGFLISFGATIGIGDVTESYRFVSIGGFLILAFSGLFAISTQIGGKKIDRPTFRIPKSHIIRTLFHTDFRNGIVDGVEMFLPLLFIMIYLGQEAVVGSIQTITTIVAVVILGLTGRLVQVKHFSKMIAVWGASVVIAAWIVAVFLGPVGVLVAILVPAFTKPFRWAVFSALLHGSIDKALRNQGGDRYSYLMVREWVLNGGRTVGLLLVLGLFVSFGQGAMLRYGLLIAAITMPFLIASVRKLVRLQ